MKKSNFFYVMALALALVPMAAMAQSGCVMTLPYSMDFEGLSTGSNSFAPCWTRVDSCINGTAVYPNIYNYGSTHGKVLNFNGNGASVSGTMRAATPRIPAPLNQLELSFAVYKSTLYLYAATNPADLTTYHLIGSYAPGYSWVTYEVRTDTIASMPSDTGYLVFAGNFGSGYGNGNAYLDDLSIIALNACARPTEVSVSNIHPTTATVSWPAVAGASNYLVTYDTVDNFSGSTVMTESVTGTSVELDFLEPGTTYYVWVQTLCGENSTSDPRGTSFTTQNSCYAIEDLQIVGIGGGMVSFQWAYDPRGNDVGWVWVVAHDLTDASASDIEEMSTGSTFHFMFNLDPTHVYEVSFYTICGTDTAEASTIQVVFPDCGQSQLSNGGYDKSATFPIAAGYDASTSRMLYDASILYAMDTIRGIALHHSAEGSSVNRTLNIYIGHTTLDSLTSNPGTTGLTQVANGVSYALPVQEWDTLLFTTPFIYDGSSNVIVAIDDITGTHNSGSPAQWYWHGAETKTYYSTTYNGSSSSFTAYQRPDIRFVGPCHDDHSCDQPIAALESVDSTAVSVTWVSGGTQWVVEYRPQGVGLWTVADTVTNNDYILAGLTPSTNYEVRVGVICNGVVRYSPGLPFQTECAMLHIPFHFTQNDMISSADNGFAPCWHHSTYFYRGRLTDSHRGYVRNAGNGEWFMLPPIAEPLSGARLRSWISSSDEARVKVGIASLDDASDVVWVDTIDIPVGNPNISHDEYVAYFDGYTGDGNRIVVSPIVNNDFHFVYFFDFHVEPIEDCRPVSLLAQDSATANSVSVSWTPVGSDTSWAVFVDGVQAGVATGTPSYTVTGLNAYTTYEVSVRALCGGTDTSDAATVTCQTACAGEGCHFTLNAHSSSGDGWNGARLVISADSIDIATFTMRNGSALSTSYYICEGMELSFTWLSGNNDQVCSFEVLNANGDTVYRIGAAANLGEDFFVTDSICYDTPGVNPGIDDTVYYTVSVDYDITRGTVTGAGTYAEGTVVTLRATPFEGYRFTGWSNGEQDSVLSFALTSNVSLTANFAENVGIDDVDFSAVSITPNPASSTVRIEGLGQSATLCILDGSGREVCSRSDVSESIEMDVTGMARGVYFVRIVSSNTSTVRKLIVR